MSPVPHVAKARVAKLDDVDKIMAFYEKNSPVTVYKRHRLNIEQAVGDKLFLIIEDMHGRMIGGSGVYLLKNGLSTDGVIINNATQPGVAAELGSVLFQKDGGLPPEQNVSGVWLPFLWSVPMILLSMRVGMGRDSKGEPKLPVDFLVCDVQTSEDTTIRRIQGQNDDGSIVSEKSRALWAPLFWRVTKATPDLERSFYATTDDPNAKLPKVFFLASLSNLVLVSKYLQKCIQNDGLVNREGETLLLDMSDIIDHMTLGYVNQQRVTHLDQLVTNARQLETLASLRIGWNEMGRIRDGNFKKAIPLQKANSGYHPTDVQWAKILEGTNMGATILRNGANEDAASGPHSLRGVSSTGASGRFAAAATDMADPSAGRIRARHQQSPPELLGRGRSTRPITNLQGPSRRTAALI